VALSERRLLDHALASRAWRHHLFPTHSLCADGHRLQPLFKRGHHRCRPPLAIPEPPRPHPELPAAKEFLSHHSDPTVDPHSDLSTFFLRCGQAPPMSSLLSATPNPVCRPANLLPEPSPLHLVTGSHRNLAGHRQPVKPDAFPCSNSWAKWPNGPGKFELGWPESHSGSSPVQLCHFLFFI
jgi:hypothetical protein